MNEKDYRYLLLLIDLRTGFTQVVSLENKVLKQYQINCRLLGLGQDTDKVRLYISKIPRMTLKQCNQTKSKLQDRLKNKNDYLIVSYII